MYLPRPSGVRAARTLDGGNGIRVDLDEHGTPMGLEITAPAAVTVAQLNAVLAQQGIGALDAEEWAPLAA